MAPILASTAAGVFLALAAVMVGSPVALLLLAAAAMGAYLSHLPEPLWLRLAGHYGGLALGGLAFIRVAWAIVANSIY